MSAMTNYYETLVLNAARGITAIAPVNVYVALFVSDPTETGTGGVELAYAGYTRQSVTFGTPTASDRDVRVSNTNAITFPLPDTSGSVVPYAAIMDSPVGGNMLLHRTLADPLSLTTETSPRFAAGEIWFSLPESNMDVGYKSKVLDYLRGINITGFTPFFAMYEGDPFSGGVELSGAGYRRLPLEFGEPAEQVSGQMLIANTNVAESERAIASWGVWSHGVIMTAETAGDRWFYKANWGSYPMRNGAQAYINAGSIRVAVN